MGLNVFYCSNIYVEKSSIQNLMILPKHVCTHVEFPLSLVDRHKMYIFEASIFGII